MWRFSIFILGSFIAGCTNGPYGQRRDIDTGGQQQGVVVSCSGYKTWQDCARAAARVCPNGYEILAKDENVVTQGRTLRIGCK